MKTTLLLAVPALFAGAVMGAAWQGDRMAAGEAERPAAAEAPRGPDGDGAEPRQVSGTATVPGTSPAPGQPRAVATPIPDLRARFAFLLDKKDGDGIRALIRDLQDRGEEAFPLLAEILKALYEIKDRKAIGLDGMFLDRLMEGTRMRPFAAWGVSRPDFSGELHQMMVWNVLAAAGPDDNNRVALAFLEKESDPEMCEGLAWSLDPPAPEEVKSMIEAYHAHSLQQRVSLGLLSALAGSPTLESIRFLESQTASADPTIAEHALVALRTARPPVAGVLLTTTDETGKLPFRAGDIVVSWNGVPVGTATRWYELGKEMKISGESVVVEVERNGVIEQVTLKEPPLKTSARAVKPAGGPR
ncbi:MAG: hypothetical protein K8T20_01450 [Planctomycetes bacterium]|nr:hypothetical protein [Planctomycetota bacterium]